MAKNQHSYAKFILLLSLMSPSAFSQTENWGGFKDILADQTGSSGGSSGNTTTVNSESGRTGTAVSQTGSCSITKESQSTLPLSLLKKLGAGNDFFQVKEVPGSNRVEITSTKMISECNDMLEMAVDKSTSEPVRYFAKVMVKGSKKVSDFVNCINDKAFKAGKPDPDASIGTLSADFSFEKSGELVFLSEGPLAGATATEIKGCDYIEPIAKDKLELLTVEDRNKKDREGHVNSICKSAGSYRDISDEIIGKYQEYKSILESIRNELLLDEVKKLSKSIQTGDDLSGLDFSIIGDYKKYIIDPLMNEVKLAYEDFQGAEGDNRKALEKRYKELKAKLAAYGKSPFLTESDYVKLKAKGQFDAADDLFVIRSSIKNYNKIGLIEDGNKVITPSIANTKIKNDLEDNRMTMKEERLKYAVKTGEITGKSTQYANISKQLNNNIAARQKDFDTKSQMIMQKAYKECPRKFTQQSQQRCMSEYANALKRMQTQLSTRNDRDRLLAGKFSARATEYAEYEKTGNTYRKNQDGEIYDEDSESSDEDIIIADTEISMPIDLSMPSSNNDQFRNPAVNNQGGGQGINFMNPNYFNNSQPQMYGQGGYQPNYMGNSMYGNYNSNPYNNFYGGGFNQGFGGGFNQGFGGGFNQGFSGGFNQGFGGGFNQGFGGGFNQGFGGGFNQGFGGGFR